MKRKDAENAKCAKDLLVISIDEQYYDNAFLASDTIGKQRIHIFAAFAFFASLR